MLAYYEPKFYLIVQMLYIHTVLCFSFTIHQIKCHIYISFQRWFVFSNAFVFSYQQNASNNCVRVYILFYFQQQHCGYHREVIVDWWRQLAAILFMPQWVSLRYGYTDMREQMARICGLIGFPHSRVHGAHLGPTGPMWAPCLPHEACYLDCHLRDLLQFQYPNDSLTD